MSDLEKREFEYWFNSQRITDFSDSEAQGFYSFTKKELMEFARKAWEKSKEQELKRPLPTIEEMIGILAD
jgi:hypothetical protein